MYIKYLAFNYTNVNQIHNEQYRIKKKNENKKQLNKIKSLTLSKSHLFFVQNNNDLICLYFFRFCF